MDQILVAMLQSSKPEALKEQLVRKMLDLGRQPQKVADVRSMLQTCIQTILQHNTDYEVEQCQAVYSQWAKNNIGVLTDFFSTETLQFLLNSEPKYAVDMLWIVHQSFSLLQNTVTFQGLCKIVQLKAISFVRDNPDFPTIHAFCRLLNDFRFCIPQGVYTATFCIDIINAVGTFSAPQTSLYEYINGVSHVIGGLLNHIWVSIDEESIMRCLQAIFVIISKESHLDPSFALGGIVQHIPTRYVDSVTRATVTNEKIGDANMKLALGRMIDWLGWPGARNINLWVVAFLKGLAAVKKYTVLIEITQEKILNVYDKLRYPVVQGAAFSVLSHMLLSFQHSPQAFHKVVGLVPATVRQLEEQGEAVYDLLISFSHLLHTLIYLHPGFPDLYEPVLDAIKDLPQPSADSIQSSLTQSKWTAQQRSVTSVGSVSVELARSETGKTGLVNLGNTCYMNSVLQALFMCDSLRQEVLTASVSVQQAVLMKLQKSFAFLALTQRAAYSPTSLLEATRPPWFTPGCQQDCSEYLRYLLDQLHEQELERLRKERDSGQSQHMTGPLPASPPKDPKDTSAFRFKLRSAHQKAKQKEGETPKGAIFQANDNQLDPTLIQRMFGGNILNTYTCLVCQRESSHMESFNDLPLAFPDGGNRSPGGTLHKPSTKRDDTTTMAGGDTGSAASQQEPTASMARSEPASSALTLEDLLSYYLEPEKLEGANKYHCERCGGLQEAERRIKVVSSPEYLILTLLRFSYNIKTQSRSKIFSDVKYPKTLYLPVNEEISMDISAPAQPSTSTLHNKSHHSKKPAAAKNTPPTSPRRLERFVFSERLDVYGLCGVIVHSGLSSDGGHYYCYARHARPSKHPQPTTSQDNDIDHVDYFEDRWFLFNDSRVSYSSYASFSNVTKKFAKDTAYVLIYKKIRSGDVGESGRQSMDVAVKPELRDAVEKDNRLHLQEQEAAERARAARRQQQTNSYNSGWYQGWGDHNGPPGSCGGGGGGFSTGPRFVC